MPRQLISSWLDSKGMVLLWRAACRGLKCGCCLAGLGHSATGSRALCERCKSTKQGQDARTINQACMIQISSGNRFLCSWTVHTLISTAEGRQYTSPSAHLTTHSHPGQLYLTENNQHDDGHRQIHPPLAHLPDRRHVTDYKHADRLHPSLARDCGCLQDTISYV